MVKAPCMSIEQMQQQLINQISTVTDKNILIMLEEELSFYLQHKDDLTDLITENEYKELAALAKEPIDKNSMSLNEFNTIMEKWRMK